MQGLDHLPHLLVQLDHQSIVVATFQGMQARAHVRNGLLSLLQVCLEPLLLQLLEVFLQKVAEGHVEEPQAASEKGGHQQGTRPGDEVLHVDADQPAHEIEAPEAEEHCKLPGVYTHLSTLNVVQPGASAALAEVDHADAAERGPDVSHRASHMRGSDDGAEVGGAHGVLQATCASNEARRDKATRDKRGKDKEGRVHKKGQAVEGLASKVHLVLVNEKAARVGAHQKRED
mmetsp:Transcript_42192/g.100542  ORF Transcript_42192/g.100542 Transcript_42192/m.100542 type:complete len:231 (+) Transcript_42192:407-1099(+)